MKPTIAVLAALLLAACACARQAQAPAQPVVRAEPIDIGPAELAEPPLPAPAALPEPAPSAEEIAAFEAPVPK